MQDVQDQVKGSESQAQEKTAEVGGELIDKLLQANSWEQAGEIGNARSLYKEIVAEDGDGYYGLSAKKALESLGDQNGSKAPVGEPDPATGKIQEAASSGEEGEEGEELIDKLLQANSWEQAGEIGKAKRLYEEIVAADGEGFYGLSAQKALESLPKLAPLTEQEEEGKREETEATATEAREKRNSPAPSAEAGGELIDKLLQANNWEQAGERGKARRLYEEIIAADGEGFYGLSAQKALESLPKPVGGDTDSQEATTGFPEKQPKQEVAQEPVTVREVEPHRGESIKLHPLTSSRGFNPTVLLPQRLRKWWGNLGVRNTLTILLVSAAVIPMVSATATVVLLAKKNAQIELKEKLKSNLDGWEKEYVLWQRDDSSHDAETLGRLVEASKVDLSDSAAVERNKSGLLRLLRPGTTAGEKLRPELTKSFWLLTDSAGRTVAQTAKIHVPPEKDAMGYPILPPEGTSQVQKFEQWENPVGIDMGKLAIVQKVMETGKPLSGVELVPWEYMAPLGLGEQVKIQKRTRAESGNRAVEVYRTGLATMAVYPVRVNDKIVGMAVVGVLLNNNYALLDHVGGLYDLPVLSLFASNIAVNTKAPAISGGTRAIGTLASEKVTSRVLVRGEEFVQTENINGVNYVRMYRPLYDHRQVVTPGEAKAIGMISVGRPQADLAQVLAGAQFLGLGIGAIMLVLVLLVGIPVAGALASSLRSLGKFAEIVGGGVRGTRLEATAQKDEVGILAQQLNEMASSIESNIDSVDQQAQRRRQEVEQQRQAKERLQRQVIDLLMKIEGVQQGNLTVRVPQMEGEVGAISDAFNATVRSLRQLVTKVKTVTREVTQEAKDSEMSVEKLSTAALTQSKELTQALAEVVEIASSIERVAQSSQEAAHLARRVTSAAQLGDTAMDKTVVSMDNIRTAVANTAKKAKRLAESSQEISQMVEMISAISEKANLLAFNASIEAARAGGSQGQGFRQVAEQVRGLAGQVSESASNIEQLISSIQVETADVLNGMEMGTAEVVTGTQLVGQTKQTLQGLTELSEQIDAYLQDVATNTVAQTEASRSVNQRMEMVANIAVTTSNEAQSVSSLLEELVKEVEALQVSVERFQVE